jgi:hypothetical protein
VKTEVRRATMAHIYIYIYIYIYIHTHTHTHLPKTEWDRSGNFLNFQRFPFYTGLCSNKTKDNMATIGTQERAKTWD